MTDWRRLFGASSNHSLDFFPPTDSIVDGVITVAPPPPVFEEGIQDWQFSLVAQFLGKAPNFSYLYRVLTKLWEQKGFITVKFLGSNLFLFQFSNAESRDWILENGPWHVKNIPMILRKWEPNMSSLQFDLDKLPLWVQLHQVPLELFTKTGLSYLSSAIGTPLYMDSITAARRRLSYAKVCVEIKAGSEIPNIIKVVLQNGSTASISVSLPWKPSCCSTCLIFCHNDSNCLKNKDKKTTQIWQPKTAAPTVVEESVVDPVVVSEPVVMAGLVVVPKSVVAPSSVSMDSTTAVALEGTPKPMIAPKPVVVPTLANDGFHLVIRSRFSEKSKGKSVASAKANSTGQIQKIHVTGSSNKFNLFRDESLNDIIASCSKSLPQLPSDHDNGENSQIEEATVPSSPKEVWPLLVDQAKTMKTRAASKGVANILQDLKSQKAKNLAKAKQAVAHLQ